jgi:hypothetical protein
MTANNDELKHLLEGVNAKVDHLARVVGEESEDGKSGTGLFGEVRRAGQEVAALKSLRDRGLGLLLGILIVAAVLALGVKQAVTTVLGVLK